MAAVRHLRYLKFNFSTCQTSLRLVKSLLRYSDFCDFQDGGRHHFWFSKIWNFNSLYVVGANMRHRTKFCQNRSKRLRRYGDLTVFKWRPSAILDFWNSNFVTVWAINRPILHHRAKFTENRLNRCWNIAIFVIFKMAAAAILDFQKFEILTVCPL